MDAGKFLDDRRDRVERGYRREAVRRNRVYEGIDVKVGKRDTRLFDLLCEIDCHPHLGLCRLLEIAQGVQVGGAGIHFPFIPSDYCGTLLARGAGMSTDPANEQTALFSKKGISASCS